LNEFYSIQIMFSTVDENSSGSEEADADHLKRPIDNRSGI